MTVIWGSSVQLTAHFFPKKIMNKKLIQTLKQLDSIWGFPYPINRTALKTLIRNGFVEWNQGEVTEDTRNGDLNDGLFRLTQKGSEVLRANL